MDIDAQTTEERARELLQQERPLQLHMETGPLLLLHQNPNLGHLIGAERSVFYLNILYSLLLFRRSHELEPLHETIFNFILTAQQAETDGDYDTNAFNQDMRQLEQWELVGKRIERERLRGYKDSRRRKFRYRISDQALSFLQWLEDQLRESIEPQGTDTRNLLEEVVGGVNELQRTLNKITKSKPDPDKARTATYQLSRLGHLSFDINQSLADFNTRLITFTLERYELATAQTILSELEDFLKNYINRIQLLRREIVPELENLAAPRFAPKWELCKALMEEEAGHTSMLMRSRSIPDARQEINRLIHFFELNGQLDQLCARIRTSAQDVWRKLYTHLRELERKSHRMEDLHDRIGEMAACPEERIFSDFINQLIAPSRMVADMHYWDAAEKAEPPQPRQEQHKIKQAPVNYLKPKSKGDPAAIRSLNEENLHRILRWAESTQSQWPAALSKGNYSEFNDQTAIIELARNGLLGNKTRLENITGLKLEPTDNRASVKIDERLLEFHELMISKADKEQDNGH